MKSLLSLWDTSPLFVVFLFIAICGMVVFHRTEVQLSSMRKFVIALVTCILATILSIFAAKQIYTRVLLINAAILVIVSYIMSEDDEKNKKAIVVYYVLILAAIFTECSGFH